MKSAKQEHAELIAEAIKCIEDIVDHLEDQPEDNLHWGHVGSLGEVVRQLKDARDFACQAGECQKAEPVAFRKAYTTSTQRHRRTR